jgi:hypothetical protein
MEKRKPTPKQIEAMLAVQQGRVSQKNCGHSAWRIHGASPHVIGRLFALGWVNWPQGGFVEHNCELTDAGRTVLRDHQETPDGDSRP